MGEAAEPRYSHNWALARRASFLIYNDRVECGDWVVRFDDVNEAIVYQTSQWFIPVQILHLTTSNHSYQFGFNPWTNPIRHLNLETTEQKIRLKYSPFSLIIRAAVVGWLVYEAWRYFQ